MAILLHHTNIGTINLWNYAGIRQYLPRRGLCIVELGTGAACNTEIETDTAK